MRNILIAAALLSSTAAAHADDFTCYSDSYGMTTCHDGLPQYTPDQAKELMKDYDKLKAELQAEYDQAERDLAADKKQAAEDEAKSKAELESNNKELKALTAEFCAQYPAYCVNGVVK
jgi:hypothetical protein